MQRHVLLSLVLAGSPAAFSADAPPPAPIPAPSSTEKVDPAKRTEVIKFLKVSGAEKAIGVSADSLIAQFKAMVPNADKDRRKFFDELASEIKAQKSVIMDRIVPVYARRFSLDELKEINKFYEGKVGGKLASELPGITRESSAIGSIWGQEIAQKIVAKMQEKGLLKNPPGAGPTASPLKSK